MIIFINIIIIIMIIRIIFMIRYYLTLITTRARITAEFAHEAAHLGSC